MQILNSTHLRQYRISSGLYNVEIKKKGFNHIFMDHVLGINKKTFLWNYVNSIQFSHIYVVISINYKPITKTINSQKMLQLCSQNCDYNTMCHLCSLLVLVINNELLMCV